MAQEKQKDKWIDRFRGFVSQNFGFILVVLTVLAVGGGGWAINFYLDTVWVASNEEREAYAFLGEYFGGVLNTLLSFLAFLALLVTIIIQSEELHLTTSEVKKTSEAFQKQISLLEVQTFGNTFFQLLRQHNEIVNDISIRVSCDLRDGMDSATHNGRDCFVFFFKELNCILLQTAEDYPDLESIKVIEKAYAEFSKNYQSEFGHYFRNLYNIIRFVDDSNIDCMPGESCEEEKYLFENRKKYVNLIRAQLSSYELVLLYYNCLWTGGSGRFKKLVDRYALFDNLELSRLEFPKLNTDKLKLFGTVAFGTQSSVSNYKNADAL